MNFGGHIRERLRELWLPFLVALVGTAAAWAVADAVAVSPVLHR